MAVRRAGRDASCPRSPPSAATARVKAGFFGMTDYDPTTWPRQPVGAVRLWDSGVTWREIETAPGVFDFSRLDAQVATARRQGRRRAASCSARRRGSTPPGRTRGVLRTLPARRRRRR